MLGLLALAAPGTGALEVGSLFCLLLAGYSITQLDFNLWALFLIMLFWFVLITGVLIAYGYSTSGEVSWPFAGSMLGLVVLLAVVAWLAPRLQRRQAQHAGQEVTICRGGLILSGALYTWEGPLNRLAGVSLSEEPGEPALEFSIRSARWLGSSSGAADVRVAVPPGQQETARQVVSALSPGSLVLGPPQP